MQPSSPLEAVLKRDRALVLGGLIGVSVLAWAYIVYLARSMGGMGAGMAMAQVRSWTGADFSLTFLMWAVMMVGMMLPAAAPMVLLFTTVNRNRRQQRHPLLPTAVFLSGYIVVWWGFAAAATAGNWALHVNFLLSSMVGESTSHYVGGALLMAAGLFQWSPLKHVCLTHCRSPLSFLMSDWREGSWGALRMGLRHGTYCVGCCWVLMGILFVMGVMNLLWVATLAGFVLLEKVAPAGHWVSRAAGVMLLSWGALLAAGLLG